MYSILHPHRSGAGVRHSHIAEVPSNWYGSSGPWVDVDKWLARMAMQTKVKGSLTVILAQWSEDKPSQERYFPEFRKVGGKLRVGTAGGDD